MSTSVSLQIPNLPNPRPTKTPAKGSPLLRTPTTLRYYRRRQSSIRAGTNTPSTTSAAASSSQASQASPLQVSAASEIIREFYGGINRRDLAAVEGLIAEGCVYEDLVFSQPFVGRKAILEFFKNFTESIDKDLQFVIDDISSEDSLAVGVIWHLEWQGRQFPFSKGCSFYRLEILNGSKQIIYGRDCVEPATKPGEVALILIGGVTWILRQFPWLADRL